MTNRIVLAIGLGLLLCATALRAQDRLDAYAKFKPAIAVFGDIESTNSSNDGWAFDETMEFGYEVGTVIDCCKGFRRNAV